MLTLVYSWIIGPIYFFILQNLPYLLALWTFWLSIFLTYGPETLHFFVTTTFVLYQFMENVLFHKAED